MQIKLKQKKIFFNILFYIYLYFDFGFYGSEIYNDKMIMKSLFYNPISENLQIKTQRKEMNCFENG